MPSSDFNVSWREFESILRAAAEDPKLFSLFLEDALTAEERRAIALRWQIMKLLSRGVSQREISKQLGVAIGTITRGSRLLINPKGAFSTLLSTNMRATKKPSTGRTASWRKELKAQKP